MIRRPWAIRILAVSLFIVPFTGFVLGARALSSGVPPVTSTLLLDFWSLAIVTAVTSFGLWRVRPWGFVLFFGLAIGLLGSDLFILARPPHILFVSDWADAVIVALGLMILLQPHVSAPYFNPRIRWWETPKRHKVNVDADFNLAGQNFSAPILDLSSTGCFVEFPAPVTRGEVLEMGLSFKHFHLEAQVRVVRRSLRPQGVGFMFHDCTAENKRELRRLIADLKHDDPQSNSIWLPERPT